MLAHCNSFTTLTPDNYWDHGFNSSAFHCSRHVTFAKAKACDESLLIRFASQMCLKPATDMVEAHAESSARELQDQLSDLEAQLKHIDEALTATRGEDPELETVRSRTVL